MSEIKIKGGKKEAWDKYVEVNSKDFYSKGVIDFSIRWANLMEEKIAKSDDPKKVIAEHANDLYRKADTEGITGFMYGCAVQGLAEFWEYGDHLRDWHNAQYTDDEVDGTINPAILTIQGVQ